MALLVSFGLETFQICRNIPKLEFVNKTELKLFLFII